MCEQNIIKNRIKYYVKLMRFFIIKSVVQFMIIFNNINNI